jgi:para-nitrobenzyl esterase
MSTVVHTASGAVEATEQSGVYAFLGVPYAEPPVEELRLAPPRRRQAWDGVRPCRAVGHVVPQSRLHGPFGALFLPVAPSGDDCLNLNIWTPSPTRERLPVLVWFHGGGFQIGAGSDPIYDGAAFARDGVVAVTINYRLGIQGYLYVAGADGAGNYGLLDQICALEWVQENIAAFGGDPDNVTLAGESAGAMSVGALLGAPAAHGLFRRAICQSGAAHNVIDVAAAEQITTHFAEALGHKNLSVDDIRELPLSRLLEVEQDFAARVYARQESGLTELSAMAVPAAFYPVYGTAELPEHPLTAVDGGSARGVGLLIGTTSDEFGSLLRVAPEQFGLADGGDIPDVVLHVTAAFAVGESAILALLEAYRRQYHGSTNFEIFGKMLSDWAFRVPADLLAIAQSMHATVYFYELSWPSPGAGGQLGAGHALDVPFVFNTVHTALGAKLTGEAAPPDLIEAIHRAWTAYAHSGNPNHDAIPRWTPYEQTERAILRFDTPCSIDADPAGYARGLWPLSR